MDLAFILTSLAVFIVVAAFVARPLIEKMSGVDATPSRMDDLISQREAILIELRDLDFDHSTGKMNDDDYTEQRARLTAKGVEILRALDTMPTTAATAEDDIEALVAQKRGKKSAPVSDDDIEALVAQKRGKKVTAAEIPTTAAPSATTADKIFCTKCGTAALSSDKFCAKCGAGLQKTWQD